MVPKSFPARQAGYGGGAKTKLFPFLVSPSFVRANSCLFVVTNRLKRAIIMEARSKSNSFFSAQCKFFTCHADL